MTKRVSISIKGDEEELLEWVEKRVDEGVFRSKSHAFCQGIKMLKDDEVSQYNV